MSELKLIKSNSGYRKIKNEDPDELFHAEKTKVCFMYLNLEVKDQQTMNMLDIQELDAVMESFAKTLHEIIERSIPKEEEYVIS